MFIFPDSRSAASKIVYDGLFPRFLFSVSFIVLLCLILWWLMDLLGRWHSIETFTKLVYRVHVGLEAF